MWGEVRQGSSHAGLSLCRGVHRLRRWLTIPSRCLAALASAHEQWQRRQQEGVPTQGGEGGAAAPTLPARLPQGAATAGGCPSDDCALHQAIGPMAGAGPSGCLAGGRPLSWMTTAAALTRAPLANRARQCNQAQEHRST